MIVLIKSSPETEAAHRGMKVARDLAADIVLIGPAAGLARLGALDGFCGTAHALAQDIAALGPVELERGVRIIDREELRALLEGEERFEGEF